MSLQYVRKGECCQASGFMNNLKGLSVNQGFVAEPTWWAYNCLQTASYNSNVQDNYNTKLVCYTHLVERSGQNFTGNKIWA